MCAVLYRLWLGLHVSDGRGVLYRVGGVKPVVFHTSLSYVCMISYRLDYYSTELEAARIQALGTRCRHESHRVILTDSSWWVT